MMVEQELANTIRAFWKFVFVIPKIKADQKARQFVLTAWTISLTLLGMVIFKVL